MNSADITLCLCLLGVVCYGVVGVGGKKVTTYAELSRLVMNGMPWGDKPTTETVKCDRSQCDHVKQLCNNGGTCYITADCGLKCACPTGFTGFFCGVKVPDLVTTIAMDLGQKEKNNKPSSTNNNGKTSGILSKILFKEVSSSDVLTSTSTHSPITSSTESSATSTSSTLTPTPTT